MAPSDIQGAEFARRARDYWRVDGIPLLVGAASYMLLVAALLLTLETLLQNGSPNENWVLRNVGEPVAGVVFITSPLWATAIVIWLYTNWEDLVDRFKGRLTYPRTGYVAPPSYWSPETKNDERLQEAIDQQPALQRWLTLFSGFWFWQLVFLSFGVLTDHTYLQSSSKVKVITLCAFLTIRAIRFALYPEAPSALGEKQANPLLKILRFFRSVLDCLWVWFLTSALLPVPHTQVWLLVFLCFGVFFIRTFGPVLGALHTAEICSCGALCAVLIWRQTSSGIVLALFVPGFYAAAVGGFRLFRYLRASPTPL